MSNASDFVIENCILNEYKCPGGDVVYRIVSQE